MKDVLNAVQDHRPRRIVGNFDDALHPQHIGAVIGFEQFHEQLEALRADGIGLAETEGPDVIVMPRYIAVMMMPALIIAVIVPMVAVPPPAFFTCLVSLCR